MNRKVTTLMACGLVLQAGFAFADDRPNVLFISLDDMNDWIGCYGGHPDAKTPNIDQLAKRGVLFTNAHCVSPICGPSRASVLTGMRPETTGVYHNRGKYTDYVPDAVTFPEHFRANGYRALAAGKVNHDLGDPDPKLWNENGPDCGALGTPFIGNELDTLKPRETLAINRGGVEVTLPANGGLSWIDRPNNKWNSFDWAPLDVSEDEFPDGKIANWAVEQLSKKHSKPLLLAAGFYKPHQPFFAPRKYFEMYNRDKVRLPKTIRDDLSDVSPSGRYLATQPWTSATHKTVVQHAAWRDAVHAYLATVSFVDALVGEIVTGLDNGPHADNTWIVLWSDHGWSLGEKQHWGKHVPWTECVRVPLIIVPPRNFRSRSRKTSDEGENTRSLATPATFKPGSRCDARVSLLDLYPTLNDIAGLPSPVRRTSQFVEEDASDGLGSPSYRLEGRSLLPLIANPDAEWNEAVVSTIGRGTHSVATDRWRYIRYFDGSEELYDLRSDTEEWTNIASRPEYNDTKHRLATHIPQDKALKQFVRFGSWKCVFPVKGKPMLFDYEGDFGISEQNDVADNRPDVVRAIQSYVEQADVDGRRVTMPQPDNKKE